MADEIPLVDFANFAIGVDATTVDHGQLSLIGEEICKAFTQIGFCYICNHGIPQETIRDAFSVSRQFLEEPVATKEKYSMCEVTNLGWIAPEKERLDRGIQAGDLRESFNYHPDAEVQKIPVDVVQNFKISLDKLFEESKELAHRVLDTMSLAMGLPSSHFLRDTHQFIGTFDRNHSIIKTLHYPTVTENVKPGQVRCGEHSDYGSLTFLFQDSIGGLEVKNPSGEYIPANPIEGAIVVNIGDLMQRWTADKMKATKHRVLMPVDMKRKHARQSIAFFLQPDDDVIIKCLDGSDKYKPMTSKDYLYMRLANTY